MMAGSHVALGAAAWLTAAPFLGQDPLSPAAVALAVAGSLLPDIDHPKSWFGKRLWPVSRPIAAIFGHRGATHSLLAVLGCGWLALRSGVPRELSLPLLAGYLSHLAADLLTPGGLRLAWPLKGTWALPLCRTGSPFEPLLVAVLLSWAWGSAEGAATLRQGAWRMLCAPGSVAREFCPAPPTPVRLARREG